MSSELRLEPDGAYILAGAELSFTLSEVVGTKEFPVMEGTKNPILIYTYSALLSFYNANYTEV